MKKNTLLGLFIVGLFFITGCGSNTNQNSKENKNEAKTKLSCSSEWFLFHSKKSMEYIIYLNKDNQLIDYETIEKYYAFDNDSNFNMICEGAPEEAELRNKSYDYVNEKAECNEEMKEVTIFDKYDISKLTSKDYLLSKELAQYLNDEYLLDLDNYKNLMTSKGYTCN